MSLSTSLPTINLSPRHQAAVRVMSADQIEINNLQNRYKELAKHVHELRRENELLHSQHALTQNALDEFECGDRDLPHALKSHEENVTHLKSELREQSRQIARTERRLRKKEEKLQLVLNDLKKSKQLVDSGQLPDKELLEDKLERANTELSSKEQHIQDLKSHIKKMTQMHNTELRSEKDRQKDVKHELETIEEHIAHIKEKIKNADKEIARGRIYEQRAARLARRASVSDVSDDTSTPPSEEHTIKPSEHFADHSTRANFDLPLMMSLRQQKIREFDDRRRHMWLQHLEKEEQKKRELQEYERKLKAAELERLKQAEEEREKQRLLLQLEADRRERERLKEIEEQRAAEEKEERRRRAKLEKKAKEESRKAKEEEEERHKAESDKQTKRPEEVLRKLSDIYSESGSMSNLRAAKEKKSHEKKTKKQKKLTAEKQEEENTDDLSKQVRVWNEIQENEQRQKDLEVAESQLRKEIELEEQELKQLMLECEVMEKKLQDKKPVAEQGQADTAALVPYEPQLDVAPVKTKLHKRKGKKGKLPKPVTTKPVPTKTDYSFPPKVENLHKGLPTAQADIVPKIEV